MQITFLFMLRQSSIFIGFMLAILALVQPAYAQSSQATSMVLEEIVVTATKRETALQETPIAISAFSKDYLDRGGVTDLRDLDLDVPSMFIAGDDGFGSFSISIRGIGSLALGNAAEEGVGVYVDGVYQGKPYGNIFAFVDVERIEVLRGPQGTLYGRNATGGAINIISKTPGDEFTGRVDLSGTRFDGFRARAYTMFPLVEGELSLKIAGAYHDRDGWTDNPLRNEDLNDREQQYLSAAANWTPGEDTQIILRGHYGETGSTVAYKNFLDGLPIDVNPSDFENFMENKFHGASITLQHEFERFTFISISGYLDGENSTFLDSDGSPAAEVEFRADKGFSFEQFSEEIRLVSTGPGRFQWIAGALFYFEDSNMFVPFDLPYIPFGLLLASKSETEAYSGFVEGSYEFTDRLKFTAGVRYSSEQKDWQGCNGFYTGFNVDFTPSLCDNLFVPDDDSWDAVTPRFVVDFKVTDDVFLYASITRGFRSGGWNFTEATLPGVDNGFDPEFVWSYEGGLKSELLDRRLRFNIAGFYADYSNLQVRVTDPVTALLNTKNAATADIYGIEVETSFFPVSGFELHANASWLDATYKDFRFIQTTGALVDHTGARLNRAPKWNVSLTGQYELIVPGWGTFIPRVEYQYMSEIFHSEINQQPQGSEPFEIVNLRLRFEPEQGSWGVQAFVENVTDDQYRTHSFAPVLPTHAPATVSDPTIWGVEVFYDW